MQTQKYTTAYARDVDNVMRRARDMGVRVDERDVRKLVLHAKQVLPSRYPTCPLSHSTECAWRGDGGGVGEGSSLQSQIKQLTSHADVILANK